MKKMNVTTSFLIVLLLLGSVTAQSLSSLTTQQVGDIGAAYSVAILKYEPLPAKPGNVVDVWIQVSNNGDKSGSNLNLLLKDNFPFSVANPSDKDIQIGSLASRSDFVAKVQMVVDDQASDGTYDLSAELTLGAGVTGKFSLPIEVNSGQSAINIVSVKTVPAEILPGSRAILSVVVENLEASELQDVSVLLDLEDSVFAPLDGSNQQKISRLSGGQSRSFTFALVAEPDAASSVYRIPVTLSATTKSGEEIVQEEVLGVVVRAQPDLSVVVDSASIVEGDEQGTILLRLVNKGLSQIKFAQVELLAADSYTIIGNNPVQYVGNIDSDDFETVEYAIKPSEKELSLSVRVTYNDALNNAYEETTMVPIVATEKPPMKLGAGSIILIVLVVVLIGVIVWRTLRKSKR